MIPVQKLSRSKKGKVWGKAMLDHLDSLVAYEETQGRISRIDKQAFYNLYNGIFDEDRLRYVLEDIKPQGKSFPARMRHYDKISPKLMLLQGEEVKRPFNFRAINKSQSAATRMQEKRKELLMQAFVSQIQGEMQDQEGNPTTPKDVEKYMNYNYRDIHEVSANTILQHLLEEQNAFYKFSEGFKDALISSEEIYWVGEVESKPIMRQCNPLYITALMAPDSPWVQDAWAVLEERYMTIPQVLDEFSSELTENDIMDLEANFRGENGSFSLGGVRPLSLNNSNPWGNNTIGYGGGTDVFKVIRYEWQSMRRVGFIEYSDEFGYEYSDMVSEEYEVPEIATKTKEGYEWTDDTLGITYTYSERWLNEWWEGTKVFTNGEPIYLNIQAKPVQRRSMENPSICKSGYIGYVYNSRNSKPISLVGRMETIQYLYNILYYRTELAFAKTLGTVGVIDMAMMPKAYIKDPESWLYYAKSMGFIFVNSAEKTEGTSANMNLFSSVDISAVKEINSYIDMLNKLDQELSDICGITRQREGSINNSELVGNTERAVTQSSHITEYWFYVHNEVKGEVLQALLDHAQHAYKKGTKIQFITDDIQRMFIELHDDEFASAEFNLFVNNSSKEARAIETLRQMAEAALSSGAATLTDVTKVLWSESISEISKTLEKSEADRNQREADMQQGQQQAEMQNTQMGIELEQERMAFEAQENDLNRKNKVEVALISAYGFSQGEDPELDLMREHANILKEERAAKKSDKDQQMKERQQTHKEKIDKEKLAIQRANKNKPKSK